MDLFDKIGKKASETYKYTAEKTSKIAKEAKIKMAMNEKKSQIEELYEEIGKKMYQHHITDQDLDADIGLILEEYCIQIDELCDRIEEEKNELLNLRDKKQCPNCFFEIEKDYHYCPNCGDKQEDMIQAEEELYKEDSKQEIVKQEDKEEENQDQIEQTD